MRQDNVAFAPMATRRRLFSPVFQAWKRARALLIIRMPRGPPITRFLFHVKGVALNNVYLVRPAVVEALVRLSTTRFQEQVGQRVIFGCPLRFFRHNVQQSTTQEPYAEAPCPKIIA